MLSEIASPLFDIFHLFISYSDFDKLLLPFPAALPKDPV